MKKFPQYEIQSVDVRGNSVTVNLVADTDCGRRIRAHATVQAKKYETLQDAEKAALGPAARNLGYEYADVAMACDVKGKHQGHRP